MVLEFVISWYVLILPQLKMTDYTITLDHEEMKNIIAMIEGSSVQVVNAEAALVLYKKFKEAE